MRSVYQDGKEGVVVLPLFMHNLYSKTKVKIPLSSYLLRPKISSKRDGLVAHILHTHHLGGARPAAPPRLKGDGWEMNGDRRRLLS
jgi:hypothetical protein